MSNVIQNHLYLQGGATLVDEITSNAPFYCPFTEIEVLADDKDSKTVRFSFESASDAPWPWFKATVEKYHQRGVRLFLFWYDADNINHNPVDPAGELVYGRFGEIYTDLIPHRDGEQSDHTTVFSIPEMGVRYTDGVITTITNTPGEFLTEHGIMSCDDVSVEKTPVAGK